MLLYWWLQLRMGKPVSLTSKGVTAVSRISVHVMADSIHHIDEQNNVHVMMYVLLYRQSWYYSGSV